MTPEEAHAVNRLMDPMPKTEPLRGFVAVYRTKASGLHLGAIAYSTQIAAWTKPEGPRVPRDLEIIDVIDVKYEPVIIDQLPETVGTTHTGSLAAAVSMTRDNYHAVLDDVATALNEPQQGE